MLGSLYVDLDEESAAKIAALKAADQIAESKKDSGDMDSPVILVKSTVLTFKLSKVLLV